MPSVHLVISQQTFLYGNSTTKDKWFMLGYHVHCGTKVFAARTLHNKSFNAATLAYSNNKEYLGIE